VHVTIESTEHDVTILHLDGDVDMKEVTSFRQVLQTAVRKAEQGVVVELMRVPFMDSSGIAVLIEGLKWSRERSLPFILTHLTPSVQMVMELAHLEGFFTIAENLDDALALITQSG
jgi:anti-sigma B factor antagonist